MVSDVLTPVRTLAAIAAVSMVLTVVALGRGPSATDHFVDSAAQFTAAYDLMQRDLEGVASLGDGLVVLDAGVSGLEEQLAGMRPLQTSLTGAAVQPSADMVSSAERLVEALREYSRTLRSRDLHAARLRLDEAVRAQAAYDTAAAELS